ncbi:phage antirepressor [Yersinia enterocolitica]|uniref:BRO-N domain-containing protein n=1 Tax=Yersinia enterocolitica TaxID=630 RepID=UPI000327EB43|nr:BRO family protein [Yersinia enterocolitica]AOF14390.1 transporter [Yersinia enterocolitica]CCV60923.1 putative phage protein [Yersinia enterocolitica (type O:2) str. YE3094/96]CFV19587.1 phage antirepressor [Yersinia enterocolitica]CNE04812.1 phage antirepressor [Yersinia enterocolitica]HDL6974619.1 transporter [Yersinia enterocolitica]
MNSAIRTFDFTASTGELLASVRTVVINQSPWFFAIDVCQALELSDTNKALLSVDDEDIREHEQYSGSGRKPLLVNESGLYSLILKSRKPKAKRFKRWITSEVLPSIRTTGSYSLMPSNDLPDFTDEVAAARAWADAKESERKAVGYVHRQAKYILHLENLFKAGMTPSQFCKQLNGVNVQQVTAFLEEHNWLYDERPESRRPAWRVKAYARDLYLTERRHLVEPDEHESFDAFTPVLLRKGAIWIYRHYLKGSLPMKKNWNGQFTHDKELAGAA